MAKKELKPGNMVYPLPAALVSTVDSKGNTNLITVAWTGTVCSDPAMLYISVRPERFSHHMLMETGEFVLNLTTKDIIEQTDFCGVKSGRDINKWEATGLTPEPSKIVKAPSVKESPVNIECRMTEVKKLGSHDMFIAEVLNINADSRFFTKGGTFDLNAAGIAAYLHGTYCELGKSIGTFGFSVKKNDSPSVCRFRERCGGCTMSNIPYNVQLKKKQEYMDALFGDICKPEPIIGMENPLHYRNKVNRVFGYDKKKGILSGTYEANSHKIVQVENCLIEDVLSQKIAGTVKELCESFKIRAYDEDSEFGLIRDVLVRRGFSTGEVMVVIVASSPVFPSKINFAKALKTQYPEIATVVLNVNPEHTSMVLGKTNITLLGPGFIKDRIMGRTFRISPDSFYQVNPVQTGRLYETAIGYAGLNGTETVIDAYSGIGTIALCAAASSGRVIGIELNPNAVKDAIINMKENGIKNVRFENGDAGDFMEAMALSGRKANVLFMDPPRSGSTVKFMSSAIKLGARKIVYISCNPETLKRDLEYLVGHGYRADKLQPVDMFPMTENVETVVLMSRKEK